MTHEPNIIIHNLDQATMALQTACECNQAVTLRSTPDAAAYLSPVVFKAMIEEAAAAVPGASFKAVLDCGNQAGLVMNALRQEIHHIRADLRDNIHAKVSSMAEQSGAVVMRYDEDPTLDLNHVDDIGSACRDWFEQTEKTLK